MSEPRLAGRDRSEWEQALLRTPGMKSSESHVLMALLRYGGGAPSCWPSNESLMLDTHLSEQTIRTGLNGLEKRLKILVRIQDMTLKTQRHIVFLTHPKAAEILAGRGMKSIPPRQSGGGMKSIPQGVSNSAPRGGMKSTPQNIIGEKQRELSVSQSGDDRLTDDSLSLSREEWGPEDGPEKICQLVGLLSRLPGECRKAALDPKNRRFFEGRWIDLAKALIIAAEPARRRNAVQNGVGYLRNLMGKPDELKPAGAALGRFLDGTMAATMAARAEREAEFRAALKAEEEAEEKAKAEEEAERARKKQGPPPPIPTPPKVGPLTPDQILPLPPHLRPTWRFVDETIRRLAGEGVDIDRPDVDSTISQEYEAVLRAGGCSDDERSMRLDEVPLEIGRWRERQKRNRESKTPEMPDWCKPPHLRSVRR